MASNSDRFSEEGEKFLPPQVMEYLVKEQELELMHVPNYGAWTYHIEIPDTKHIVGRWGYLKASGTIDGYSIENKNLFTVTGKNKLISINEKVRKAINKTGGDTVIVTLYLTATPSDDFAEVESIESSNQLSARAKFLKK
jgi:Domain of unknown function (DUF1905)